MQDINWAFSLNGHANHTGRNELSSWGLLGGNINGPALLQQIFRFHFPASHELCRSAHYTIAEVTCPAHQPIEQVDSLQRQSRTLPSKKEQKRTSAMQNHSEDAYHFGRHRNQGRLLVEDLSYMPTVPNDYQSQMVCVLPLFHHTTWSRFRLR